MSRAVAVALQAAVALAEVAEATAVILVAEAAVAEVVVGLLVGGGCFRERLGRLLHDVRLGLCCQCCCSSSLGRLWHSPLAAQAGWVLARPYHSAPWLRGCGEHAEHRILGKPLEGCC